jgi:CRP-like cAMP-binding protein
MAPTLLALIWYYLTGNLQELQLAPGDRVDADAQRVFIVTRGTGQVLRDGPGGHEILLRIVRPGSVVSEPEARLVAETPLELLALPGRGRAASKPDRVAS